MEEEDDASTEKQRKHIPAVLIEEILLNLPVKLLFRFCTVSKSWNSMILRREFGKRYRGREMVVLRTNDKHMVCPLSSISSDKPMDQATPFKAAAAAAYFDASCGELWCVEFENSLILCNPSTQQHRKLPIPSARVPIGSTVDGDSTSVFVYGLGYDSVSDDYKIIKMHRSMYVETELYSLRSDSWMKVNSPPQRRYNFDFFSSKGVFAFGALHWVISYLGRSQEGKNFVGHGILSFDLTTHKYKGWKLPKQPAPLFSDEGLSRSSGMGVFGGKLRVWRNYGCYTRFGVWVMDDYESRLWRKELEVDYAAYYPLCYSHLKPFYFYDGVGNLVKAVISSTDMRKIFLCKQGEEEDGPCSLVGKDVGGDGCGMFDTDTYVESFVSPYPYPGGQS